jgi:hypothetical protein
MDEPIANPVALDLSRKDQISATPEVSHAFEEEIMNRVYQELITQGENNPDFDQPVGTSVRSRVENNLSTLLVLAATALELYLEDRLSSGALILGHNFLGVASYLSKLAAGEGFKNWANDLEAPQPLFKARRSFLTRAMSGQQIEYDLPVAYDPHSPYGYLRWQTLNGEIAIVPLPTYFEEVYLAALLEK